MKIWTLFLALLAGGTAFVDEAARAGLDAIFYCGDDTRKNYIVETLGTGVALVDFDNDGLPDIFAVTASRLEGFPEGQEPTNKLYRNKGDGTFEDVTGRSGLGRTGWGQGVCAGDLDNDGFEDLFATYWGQNVLYRNLGNGVFEDITGAAGLTTGGKRWATGCAFVDIDLDGRLDLFVANYVDFDQKNTPAPGDSNACTWKSEKVMCGPQGLKGGTNRLWHNQSAGGKIRFTDISKAAGVEATGERYSLSVTTLDHDRDGWPDIYVAVDSQASILLHNNQDLTFTDVALESGVAYSEDGREQAGMGTAAADYDGDGYLDLVKTNFSDDIPNLYHNSGDGSFVEVTVPSGLGRQTQFLGWGAAFLDFDKDSWPDILMVNGHVYPGHKYAVYRQRRILYRNLGNGKFKDISTEAGPAILAESSARGVAVGDYDNDGSIDAVITNMNEKLSLLRNTFASGNASVLLKLVGTKSNRSAIGARVSLSIGPRKLTNEVRSGSTFMSQSDLRLHFGLGTAPVVDAIEIAWPGGETERILKAPVNRILTITEGKGITASAAFRR